MEHDVPGEEGGGGVESVDHQHPAAPARPVHKVTLRFGGLKGKFFISPHTCMRISAPASDSVEEKGRSWSRVRLPVVASVLYTCTTMGVVMESDGEGSGDNTHLHPAL